MNTSLQASAWRLVSKIEPLAELIRFFYYGWRNLYVPVIFRNRPDLHPDFQLLDGLKYFAFRRRARKQGSYSQGGLDIVLARLPEFVRGGYFVDVGCNHPLEINNTALLEREYGWRGLSIDALDRFREAYAKERSCEHLVACVGDENTEVEFLVSGESPHAVLSGVVEALPAERKRVRGAKVRTLSQQRLADIFSERGIEGVDCLFMDVEGYERKVLEGIDFEKVRIDWIVAENTSNDANQIRAFLAERGFLLRLRLPNDDIFQRADI